MFFSLHLVLGVIHDFIESWFYWLPPFIGYFVLISFGHASAFVYDRHDRIPGLAPLISSFDGFYVKHLVRRCRDGFNEVLLSRAGALVDVAERHVPIHDDTEYTGDVIRSVNLASYNYLGFADDTTGIGRFVQGSMAELSICIAASPHAGGRHRLIVELEEEISRFVGCEDAIIVAQGFATNSLVIPALVSSKNTLVISDSLNHASLVCGLRSSGATTRVFIHNDVADLERILRDAVLNGQPRTRRAWAQIIVVVEGVYSMEGQMSPLHLIVPLCQKYKATLWLDEAHSIGAIGATGRGITEFCDVFHSGGTVVKMGTFTKAFGSVGGYVAGTRDQIRILRHRAAAMDSGEVMSPPVAAQCLGALRFIQTEEGRARLDTLRANSSYFRNELRMRRHNVLGHPCSPVVPVIVRSPGRSVVIMRLIRRCGVAVVVAGYPATPMTESRLRFCLSAAHTKDQLARVLDICDEAATNVGTLLFHPKVDDSNGYWHDDGSPRIPSEYADMVAAMRAKYAPVTAAKAPRVGS